MHIQYAAETIARYDDSDVAEYQKLIGIVSEPELTTLAASVGGKTAEIAASIAATVAKKEDISVPLRTRRHLKVTDKQKVAVSHGLIEEHGSAWGVVAAAYGVSIEQMKKEAE